MLIVLILLTAATAAAREASHTTRDELRRRLDQAEARIAALEDQLRRQSELVEKLTASITSNPAVSEPPAAALKNSLVANTQVPALADPKAGIAEGPKAKKSSEDRPITHLFQSLKFNGLTQVWYATGEGLNNTFRVRRAELYLTGEVTKKARWQVMIDPAKALQLDATSVPVGSGRIITEVAVSQSSRILQNAFVGLDYIPKVQTIIGQYKLPLSLEGLQSSGELDTVERALFASDRARGGNYGDVRDLGLSVRGGLGKRVDYQAGIFNGLAEGQNDVDHNEQKAYVGRFVARPVDGLHVGSSGGYNAADGLRPQRDRWGAEFQFVRGPVRLKSEFMMGHDGPLSRRGFYGHAGFRLLPRVEAVMRVDSWDPDLASESTPASVRELDYVTGLNLFFTEHHLKFQVNYLRKTYGSAVLPSRDVVLVNTQAFW